MSHAPACAPQIRRRRSDYPGQATTFYVLKRACETLAAIDRDTLIDQTPGITAETIDHLFTTDSTTVPWSIATPLDWAWAKHVKGHDLWTKKVRHGSVSTYRSYACRCQSCSTAATRTEGGRKAGHKTPKSWADARTVERVQRHVDHLREVGTLEAIANAAGTHRDAIKKLSYRESGVTLGTAAAILNVTAADVTDPLSKRMVDSGPSRHVMGTLGALGYSRAWMEEQTGGRNRLQMVRTRTQVTARTHYRLAALASRVGDRMPTPDQVPPHIAAQARRRALAEGWFPPAAYDDDRTLDLSAIPNERWSKTDGWARRRVTVVHMLANGYNQGQAAEATHVGRDVIAKRIAHGLIYNRAMNNDESLNVEKSAERIAEIRDVYERLEEGEFGYVTAALMLGIQRADYLTQSAWNDHPEVLAWHAEQDADVTPQAA